MLNSFPLIIDGKIHLIPIDAKETPSKITFKQKLLSLEIVVAIAIEHRRDNKTPITIILDDCRSKSWLAYDEGDSFQGTSVEIGRQSNIAILYSTAEGQVAIDSGPGDSDNSPYTQLLLENVTKGLAPPEVNDAIVKGLANSGRKQVSVSFPLSLQSIQQHRSELNALVTGAMDLRMPRYTLSFLPPVSKLSASLDDTWPPHHRQLLWRPNRE